MSNRWILFLLAITNFLVAAALAVLPSIQLGVYKLRVVSAYRELQAHGVLRIDAAIAGRYQGGRFQGADDQRWTEVPYYLLEDSDGGKAIAAAGAAHCAIAGVLLLLVWWRMRRREQY